VTTSTLGGQYVRFAVVGASNTALTLTVYTLLVSAGLRYLEAFTPAFAAGAVSGYMLNRLWTFHAATARGPGLARYVSVQLTGLGLNGLAYLVLTRLGADRIMAQAIAVCALSLVTFAVCRAWVFRVRPASGPRP
jgi:putative flippase GtrA